MKKKLIVMFGLVAICASFLATTEASAKEWDSIECPPGYYFKKGGWYANGFSKAGGYCIPMGNAGRIR